MMLTKFAILEKITGNSNMELLSSYQDFKAGLTLNEDPPRVVTQAHLEGYFFFRKHSS